MMRGPLGQAHRSQNRLNLIEKLGQLYGAPTLHAGIVDVGSHRFMAMPLAA